MGDDREPGVVDLGDPINWSYAGNHGLALSMYGLSGCIGATWRDLTGESAGGVLSGSPTWSATRYGHYGLTLARVSSQYVACSGLINRGAAPFAVAAWVKVGTTSNFSSVVSQGSGTASAQRSFLMDLGTGDAAPRWCIYDGSATEYSVTAPGGSLSSGVWHRLVGFWDTSTLWMFIDGIAAASGTKSPGAGVALGNLTVGRFSTGSSYVDGAIAGVDIWVGPDASASAFAVNDYQWAQDTGTSPRFRRYSTRAWFLPQATTYTSNLLLMGCG